MKPPYFSLDKSILSQYRRDITCCRNKHPTTTCTIALGPRTHATDNVQFRTGKAANLLYPVSLCMQLTLKIQWLPSPVAPLPPTRGPVGQNGKSRSSGPPISTCTGPDVSARKIKWQLLMLSFPSLSACGLRPGQKSPRQGDELHALGVEGGHGGLKSDFD